MLGRFLITLRLRSGDNGGFWLGNWIPASAGMTGGKQDVIYANINTCPVVKLRFI